MKKIIALCLALILVLAYSITLAACGQDRRIEEFLEAVYESDIKTQNFVVEALLHNGKKEYFEVNGAVSYHTFSDSYNELHEKKAYYVYTYNDHSFDRETYWNYWQNTDVWRHTYDGSRDPRNYWIDRDLVNMNHKYYFDENKYFHTFNDKEIKHTIEFFVDKVVLTNASKDKTYIETFTFTFGNATARLSDIPNFKCFKNGHSGAFTFDDLTHSGVCDVCGETVAEKHRYVVGYPGFDDIVCIDCGYEFTGMASADKSVRVASAVLGMDISALGNADKFIIGGRGTYSWTWENKNLIKDLEEIIKEAGYSFSFGSSGSNYFDEEYYTILFFDGFFVKMQAITKESNIKKFYNPR